MKGFIAPALALLTGSLLLPAAALGAQYSLVIKNHRFHPAQVRVPAGKRLELTIDNRDATPEEFESPDLHREKLMLGHGRTVVRVGPLSPGRYHFYGEFHRSTAQGDLVAK